MTGVTPIETGFDYTTDTPDKEQTQQFMDTHATLVEKLENIFVYVHHSKEHAKWLVTPVTIQKKNKKSFFLLRQAETITVHSNEVIHLSPQPITFSSFEHNIGLILRRLEQCELLWSDDQNEAIRNANTLDHIIQQVARDIPEFENNKVETMSLYDVLKVIVPTFNNYLKQYREKQMTA